MTVLTIFNFLCKACGTRIGQFVTDDFKTDEDIKCPDCGSKDITYSTLVK